MAGQYAISVRDSLDVLVSSNKWSDVKFIVGREKAVIPAHRAILAAQSKILEAMVYPTLDEEPIDKLEIQLPTVEAPAFRAMLRAIYTDSAKLNEDTVQECLELATRFDVEILKFECAKFLKNGLTVHNVCTLLENAPKLLGDSKFAIKFIEKNTEEVVRSAGFRNLSTPALLQILASNRLEIEEVKLWQSIIPWTLRQLQEQGLEDTVENKRKILADVLPLIRFPTMQLSDIVSSVQPTGVVQESTMLKLFTFMASRGASGASDDDAKDLGFNTKPRVGGLKPWTLSSTHKGSTVVLSEKNTVATNASALYGYLLGEVGFKKGKHAWRTTVRSLSTSNQWLLVGIGARKTFTDNSSYNDTSVYGVTSCNNVYKAGVAVATGSATVSLRAGDTMDCLYDMDARTLRFATSTGQLCTIDGIPQPAEGTEHAPHYILYASNTIKVETIPVSKFGKFS